MKRAALAALALVAGCGGGGDGLSGGPSSERLTLKPGAEARLGYAEYLPPGYGDGEPRPLLVFLHGTDESGDGSPEQLERVFKLGIPPLIRDDRWPDTRPFVVLMPQYPAARAGDCRLADDLASFLTFAVEEYDVDETRIYLTGISCGAIGVWDYLAEWGGELVDAAVPIAGHAVDALAEAGCDLGRVPVWAFHGAADPIVPQQIVVDAVEDIEACDPAPADLRLTVYPGAGHDAWTRTYTRNDVYAWLLSRTGQ